MISAASSSQPRCLATKVKTPEMDDRIGGAAEQRDQRIDDHREHQQIGADPAEDLAQDRQNKQKRSDEKRRAEDRPASEKMFKGREGLRQKIAGLERTHEKTELTGGT